MVAGGNGETGLSSMSGLGACESIDSGKEVMDGLTLWRPREPNHPLREEDASSLLDLGQEIGAGSLRAGEGSRLGGVGGGVTGARDGSSEILGDDSGDVVKGIADADGNDADVTMTSGCPPKPNHPPRFLFASEAADSIERDKVEGPTCAVAELLGSRGGMSRGPELDSAAGSNVSSSAGAAGGETLVSAGESRISRDKLEGCFLLPNQPDFRSTVDDRVGGGTDSTDSAAAASLNMVGGDGPGIE